MKQIRTLNSKTHFFVLQRRIISFLFFIVELWLSARIWHLSLVTKFFIKEKNAWKWLKNNWIKISLICVILREVTVILCVNFLSKSKLYFFHAKVYFLLLPLLEYKEKTIFTNKWFDNPWMDSEHWCLIGDSITLQSH